MEIIDFFDHGVALAPDADCFVMGARSWSYRSVQAKTKQIAGAFARAGLPAGRKVAVLSPNDPEAFICVLGVLRAHMVWLPINPRYALADIGNLLESFDCSILFLHSSFASALADLRIRLPGLERIIAIDASFEGIPSFSEWIQDSPADCEIPAAAPEDVVVILPTGGTTGKPKGVMQAHRGFECYVASHLATMPQPGRPRYLVAAPMTHAAGFLSLPMFVRGGTVFIIESAKPRLVAEAIVEHCITDVFLPPTVIYMMLADPEIRSMKFDSLRYLLYGAAPMSVEKLREALTVFGPVLVQGFGQVEAMLLCTVLKPEDHFRDGSIADDIRLSSCGRPAPFVNVAVMADDGKLLDTDEVGEIVVRASNVMRGYYRNPEATAAASRYGWHHTGDVGYRDGQGYYHLVDRARDIIISGGLNIYPSEIEQVIWAHPAVQDCAVIGIPDDKWGEAVTAVVELKPEATVDDAELMALCKDKLGSIKAPKSIVYWPALPRSPVGKVLKREIRETFWRDREGRV